jgi:hypothetical protein
MFANINIERTVAYNRPLLSTAWFIVEMIPSALSILSVNLN